MSDLEEFTKGYIDSMFWTEEEEIGSDKDLDHLSKDDRSTIENECIAFFQANETMMRFTGCKDFSLHGHDFWLTRNSHGVGYWDRGYKKEVSEALTKYCEECKPAYLLLDDENDGISYNSEWVL